MGRNRVFAKFVYVLFLAVTGATALPAAAQTAVMAMPASYETYNNVTQSFVLSQVVSYTSLNNSYVAANPQVPTGQFSYIALNNSAAGNRQFLRSTVPTFTPAGALDQLVNATIPAAAGPNNSFAGLLLGRRWNGIDVVMTQCFSGGFAFNMQGSLMGAGAIGAPANSPVQGYTFQSSANYNEFSFGTTNPRGQVLTNANVAVGDFTQGWANNNFAANHSMVLNFAAAYQNDPFTARGNGAATPAALGFPNQVTVGPNLPPQPANFNNIKELGFESPTYASSDPLVNILGVNILNPLGANNSRPLGTDEPLPPGVPGPTPPNRWAILMAPSAGDRTDFSIDIARMYATLIAKGVAHDRIAVLYGNGNLASLRIPGSTAPVGGSSMLPANNLPNINAIPNGAGGMLTSIPVHSGMERATIQGLFAGNAATWTSLGLAAPPAGNTSNLFVYTTGHGGSVNAGAADLNIANERTPKGFANLLGVHGLVNFNPAITNQTTEIQFAMSRAIPNLTDPALNSIWVNGINGTAGAFQLGPITQVFPADFSAYDITELIQGPAEPELFFYDVAVPASYWQSGIQDLFLSLESLSLSDLEDFNASLRAITLIDTGDRALIQAGEINAYTVTLVPEPASLTVLGTSLLLLMRRSGKRYTTC